MCSHGLEKLLREATEISLALKARRLNAFGHHTLVKIGLSRLTDTLNKNGPATDADIEAVTRDIERNLSEGLQRFPGDSYLLDAEAQLAQIFDNSDRMVAALRGALAANPRNSFAAVRLATYHTNRNELPEATQVLRKAIDAHPGDRRLHFAYSRVLLAGDAPSGDELLYHLQRSFTPGDSNYDAQLLYGRQLFIRHRQKISDRTSSAGTCGMDRVVPAAMKSMRLKPDSGELGVGEVLAFGIATRIQFAPHAEPARRAR